jgi:D-alanyl-D-alanine-carboxypeptidase/D-alanyl-D-alanine-endopeptidase
MPMADRANPYADYTVEQLYAFLSNHDLRRDIGKAYEYSNLGAGLLGHALARRAGMDYEALVRERITGPLGMDSTVVSLTPELSARMAQGHDDQLKPTSNWDIPTLAGAGALRSTANDLLNLLAAELGFLETPLAPAMRAQYAAAHETDIPNTKIALGWHITTVRDREIVWHNGGSGGFRCFLGFDRAEGLGAVVLTNLANMAGADDVGFHLLRGSPVAVLTPPEPKRVRQAIALPSEVLQAYAGVYQISPNMRVTVTRDGQRLLAQLSGAPNEIFPESRTDFFWKVVDAQITFDIDVDGRVTGATLHQGGRHTPPSAWKPSRPPPPASAQRSRACRSSAGRRRAPPPRGPC